MVVGLRGAVYVYTDLFVGVVLKAVLVGVWPCNEVPRKAAANIAIL
jgi:hypothetical protein